MFGIEAPTVVTLFFLRSSRAARMANHQNGGPVSPRGDSWTNPCLVQETFKMSMHTLQKVDGHCEKKRKFFEFIIMFPMSIYEGPLGRQ